MARQPFEDLMADDLSHGQMGPGLDRRHLLAGASGLAASLMLPGLGSAAAAAPLSPERSLLSYRRMLCGAEGERIFWWYIGDLYVQNPGKTVAPIARALTIGSYIAGKSGPRSFRYKFREAGVIVDLETGERLTHNPLTGAPAEVPLVDEPQNEIEWNVQENGNILRTQHGKTALLDLRWTETPANMLLIETTPGPNAFAIAPADPGADWNAAESTRTVYAKRAALNGHGFVPAQMIYQVAIKMTPAWLADGKPGDRWLIVRGIGQKSRANEIVNRDALGLVRRNFPDFF